MNGEKVKKYPCTNCLFIHTCKEICSKVSNEPIDLNQCIIKGNNCIDCGVGKIQYFFKYKDDEVWATKKSRISGKNIETEVITIFWCDNCRHVFTHTDSTKLVSRGKTSFPF